MSIQDKRKSPIRPTASDKSHSHTFIHRSFKSLGQHSQWCMHGDGGGTEGLVLQQSDVRHSSSTNLLDLARTVISMWSRPSSYRLLKAVLHHVGEWLPHCSGEVGRNDERESRCRTSRPAFLGCFAPLVTILLGLVDLFFQVLRLYGLECNRIPMPPLPVRFHFARSLQHDISCCLAVMVG